MLMRDAQNTTSFVEENREAANAAVIFLIYNYLLRLTIFIQFRQFIHYSKS